MTRTTPHRHQPTNPPAALEAAREQPIAPLHLMVCALIVFGIVFCTFLPALQNQFVDWDDTDNFLRNESFRGLKWDNIKWMFTTFHMGHYQPLTWLTLGVDATIAKMCFHDALDPRPYHFTNVLLHSINAVLVFLLAMKLIGWRRADGTGSAATGWSLMAGAIAAALLFGVHPLRVESVAWATERRDLLSAFFVLLTVLAYLRANQSGQQHRTRWMVITLALFVCSLLSKVIGATLPVVLLMLDWFPLRRIELSPRSWFSPRARAVLLEKIPFFVLALVFSTIASIGQGNHHWLITMEQHRPIARLVQSPYGLMFYVQKTLLPIDLLPLYERHDPMNINEPRFIVATVLVPIALVGLAILLVKGKVRTLVAAAAIYMVMLLPVLGFVQNGPQIVADRYSYLPCVGWAIALGCGMALLLSRRPCVAPVAIVVAFVIPILAALTWIQTSVWHNTASLWGYMAKKDPNGAYANNSYGYVLLMQDRLDEAIEHFNRAIDIQPAMDVAYHNLWDALERKHDIQGFRTSLELATTQIPRVAASGRYRLGNIFLNAKDYEQAAQQYQASLAINEASAPAHVNLALALEHLGRMDDAIAHYHRATEIDPNLFQARFNYGLCLERAGQSDRAIEQFRRAAELNPTHAGTRSALDRLQKSPPRS